MTLSTKQVVRWLNPWPIGFKKRDSRWTLRVCTLVQVERLAACWKLDPDDPRSLRSIRWWAQQAKKGKCPVDQHYIHMIAQHHLPVQPSLTILVIWHKKAKRWIVIDGNHHLIAAVLVDRLQWRRQKTKFHSVGVLIRFEPGQRYPRKGVQ